jgi:hypothetical protein
MFSDGSRAGADIWEQNIGKSVRSFQPPHDPQLGRRVPSATLGRPHFSCVQFASDGARVIPARPHRSPTCGKNTVFSSSSYRSRTAQAISICQGISMHEKGRA